MLMLERDERLNKTKTGFPEARLLSLLNTIFKRILGDVPRAIVLRSLGDLILIRMKGVVSGRDKSVFVNYQNDYRVLQIYKRQVIEAAKPLIMSSLSDYLELKVKDLFYDLNPERNEALMVICFAGNVEDLLTGNDEDKVFAPYIPT